MILLDCINALIPMTSEIQNKTRTIFKTIQNIYYLPVVLYATYACYSNDINTQINMFSMIKWQCIFDSLLCTPDLMIHHIAVLLLIYPSLNSISALSNLMHLMIVVLKTELSTVFLISRDFIPKKYKTITLVNNLLFMVLFMYTRIYEYSKKIIYNETLNSDIDKYYSPYDAGLIKIGIYLLYFMNLYWFAIIIKTIVKKINETGFLLSFQQSERIIKYLYFTSPVACAFIYKPFLNAIYFLDTFGVIILSVTSYEYHNAVSIQKTEEKNVLDDDLIWYYIDDVLMIHIRCFFCILTNTNLYKVLTTMAPNMYINMTLVYFSLLFHSASMYHFVKYLITLKSSNQFITIYKNPPEKTQILHLTKSLPILVDSIIMIYNTNDLYIRNNGILITILIMIIMSVQPFYQMNHLVFHVLLLFQTIFLCQSNVFVNEHL
jgi:hypothetical protein